MAVSTKTATIHSSYKLPGHVLGIIGLMVMIIISVVIKERDLEESLGAQNLEATYHVLLTVEALRQNPIRDHWLLPTVTLGQEGDAFVPWGSTSPTKSGDYIYTSFNPPSFLLPYVVFKVFDLQPTIRNLARINMIIGAMVGVFFYLLLLRLLLDLKYSFAVALVSTSVAFF